MTKNQESDIQQQYVCCDDQLRVCQRRRDSVHHYRTRPTEARLRAEHYGGETPGFTDETDGGVRHVAMYGRDRAEHFGGETPSFTDEADGGVRHVAMCGRDRAEPFGGETPSFTDETDGGVRHVAMCGRDQAERLESRLLISRTNRWDADVHVQHVRTGPVAELFG